MSSTIATLRSTTSRTARVLGNTAIIAVMLVSVAFLLPSLFGYERYVITGGSMSGTFERGSIAFEKAVPVSQLRVGDVITYMPPADSGLTHLVTHRIMSTRTAPDGTTVFRTQGDANATVDPWKFQLYAGTQPKVEFTVPAIGYVFIALADRSTRILVIGVPAAAIALASLIQLARALRPTREAAPAAAMARSAPALRIPAQSRPTNDNAAPVGV